jgi:hypothetical protein
MATINIVFWSTENPRSTTAPWAPFEMNGDSTSPWSPSVDGGDLTPIRWAYLASCFPESFASYPDLTLALILLFLDALAGALHLHAQ